MIAWAWSESSKTNALVIFHCITNYPKNIMAWSNSIYYLSLWARNLGQINWVPWLWVPHVAAVISRPNREDLLLSSFMGLLAGLSFSRLLGWGLCSLRFVGQKPPWVPCHVALRRTSYNMAASEQEGKKEGQGMRRRCPCEPNYGSVSPSLLPDFTHWQ